MKAFNVKIFLMKESCGISYWVAFQREDGKYITPYRFNELYKALHEAIIFSQFFGLPECVVEPNEDFGLTQEMIDEAYKDARFGIFTQKY